jgi:hypothetical protein
VPDPASYENLPALRPGKKFAGGERGAIWAGYAKPFAALTIGVKDIWWVLFKAPLHVVAFSPLFPTY